MFEGLRKELETLSQYGAEYSLDKLSGFLITTVKAMGHLESLINLNRPPEYTQNSTHMGRIWEIYIKGETRSN